MEEMVYIVDENDNIIREATWDDAFKNNLRKRNVRIFILNSKGEMLIAKRSKALKIHPDLWSQAASGSVTSGEGYEEAAKKELFEELGIKTKLNFLYKIDEGNNFCGVFDGIYDGKVKPNNEVEAIEFIKINKLKEEIKKDSSKFTEGFKRTVEKYLKVKDIR